MWVNRSVLFNVQMKMLKYYILRTVHTPIRKLPLNITNLSPLQKEHEFVLLLIMQTTDITAVRLKLRPVFSIQTMTKTLQLPMTV